MSAIVDDAAVKTGPPVAAEIANRVLGRITRDRNGSDRQVIPALLSSSLAAAAIILQQRAMFTVSIDEATLGEIVRRLVEATDPDQIVMFGSRARGDARPDSDLDLLIIKDSDEPRHRRAIPAYTALAGLGIPTDIIWRTSAEIAEWSRVPNHVTTRAIREGRVLYERAA